MVKQNAYFSLTTVSMRTFSMKSNYNNKQTKQTKKVWRGGEKNKQQQTIQNKANTQTKSVVKGANRHIVY